MEWKERMVGAVGGVCSAGEGGPESCAEECLGYENCASW